MSQAQDKIFFRNFSLVVGAIAVIMVAFYIIAQIAGTDREHEAKTRAAMVAEVTEPVGKVTVAGAEVTAEAAVAEATTAVAEATTAVAEATANDSGGHPGKSVYDGLCVNCHGISALAAMIPQTGDTAAWEARIEKGIDVLYENAINGYTGDMGLMPARGGNPGLSDDEVKAAVDYIVNQVQ